MSSEKTELSTEKTFDASAEIRKIAEAQPRMAVRRLSFPVQCAAFALLKAGAAPREVAQRFGVSQSAVSALARCEQEPPAGQKWRYRSVAREYARSPDPKHFQDKYFTQDIRDRWFSGIVQHAPRGANPRSGAYANKPFDLGVGDIVAVVEWNRHAWMWRIWPDGAFLQEKRFFTTGQAYDDAFECHGLDSPRVKPGRKR